MKYVSVGVLVAVSVMAGCGGSTPAPAPVTSVAKPVAPIIPVSKPAVQPVVPVPAPTPKPTPKPAPIPVPKPAPPVAITPTELSFIVESMGAQLTVIDYATWPAGKLYKVASPWPCKTQPVQYEHFIVDGIQASNGVWTVRACEFDD